MWWRRYPRLSKVCVCVRAMPHAVSERFTRAAVVDRMVRWGVLPASVRPDSVRLAVALQLSAPGL